MAGPLDLRGRVVIVDAGATGTLNRIKGSLAALGGVAHQPMNAVTSLQRHLGAASAAAGGLAHKAGGMGGLGASFAGAYFLKQQFDFEKALNRTQAILNVTEKSAFRPLRDEIVRLAEAYPAMRTEIAKGASDLAEAGMKMPTIIGVLEGTIQGSMASGESIAKVAGGVTDIVMSMAMPFKTAAEQADSFRIVNDKLAASATTYNQNYEGVLSGLGRAGPIARAAGVSLHDTAAMLGTLADANFKAERGGIALGSTMLRLGAPTKKARGELAKFGIDLTKFQQNTGRFANIGAAPLVDMLSEELGLDASPFADRIAGLLKDKNLTRNAQNLSQALGSVIMDGLGTAAGDAESRAKINDAISRYVRGSFSQIDVVGVFREFARKDVDKSLPFLNEVIGKYHAAKAAALISGFRSGAFDEKSLDLSMKTDGATKRFAGIMMQGFVGDVYRMSSAWDAFLDRLSETGVLDTVTGVIQKLTGFIGALAQTNPKLLEWGTYAILAAGVAAPLGFALSGIASGLSVLAVGLMAVVRWGPGLARILASLTGIGPALAAIRSAGAWMATKSGLLPATAGVGLPLGGNLGAMGAAGMAGLTTATVARRIGLLGKLRAVALGAGRFLIPGLGIIALGAAAYGAYDGYKKDGVGGAIWGALGFGPADASESKGSGQVSGIPNPADAMATQPPADGGPAGALRQSLAAMRAELAGVDLTSEGQRIMSTLEAGIRAGTAGVIGAMDEAVAGIRSRAASAAGAGRVNLNTGPTMSGAR
ncbi:MAG: phage tail tape measure protein [Hyphomicrobiaceae bacterium]